MRNLAVLPVATLIVSACAGNSMPDATKESDSAVVAALPSATEPMTSVLSNDYTVAAEPSWKAGQAHFPEAGEHSMENIGASEAKFLVVARTAVRLTAGDTLPRHHGSARVVYALSDYTISYASDNAEPVVNSSTAGQAHWHAADEHRIVNTGSTEARFVMVQFKR